MARAYLKAILTAGALASVAVSTGCDPRLFDELAAETWVQASGPPTGLSAQVYGIAMASGGQRPSGDGAGFFVAARIEDGFGHLRYDVSGAIVETRLLLTDINNDGINPLANPPVMVGDAASTLVAVALSNGGPAGGPPERVRIALLDSDTGAIDSNIVLEGPNVIAGLGFGTTGVADGTRGIVLTRGRQLVVIPRFSGTSEPLSCQFAPGPGRSVLVTDLDAGIPAEEIVFAAVIGEDSVPAVLVTTGSLIEDAIAEAEADSPATCFTDTRSPLLTIPAPDGEEDFGRQMVAADFDGDGNVDLAIASPQSQVVYIYRNLDIANGEAGAAIEISAPGEAVEFASAIAAGNLDGTGGHELVVGAPASNRDGVLSAGAVYLYRFVDQAFDAPYLLGDAQPEAGQRFGEAVATVPFGIDTDTTREILVVGANAEVFTYFRTQLSSDDVRRR